MSKRAAVVGLGCVVLLAVVAMASNDAGGGPGRIRWLSKPGECKAAVGDLIVVTMASNPSTGPNNPAANLKAKVEGEAVRLVTVVYVPPAKPMPGAPGRIQAYFVAEKTGDALVHVTPISASGQPGKPWEIKLFVGQAD